MDNQINIEFNELSHYNVQRAENAINSDKLQPVENNYMLSISCQYYPEAEMYYKEILKETTPVTSYIRFASNGYGFQTYGFYKGRDKKIYIIDTYLEDIQKVFVPDKNIECLEKCII